MKEKSHQIKKLNWIYPTKGRMIFLKVTSFHIKSSALVWLNLPSRC